MCLYPRISRNKKYQANKKNGGNIPQLTDERVIYVPIGCGNCIECRKQKARSWQVRLLEDIKKNKNGKYITLTFSNKAIKKLAEQVYEINEKRIRCLYQGKQNNKQPQQLEGYTLDNEIATQAIRYFNERWRKTYGRAVRHWLVTELGHKGTENIHLHGIIWTDHRVDEIQKHWGYGFIWKGYKINGKLLNYVNGKTVNYIIKYVHKIDQKHKTYKSIVLTSPGIGKNYTEGKGDWTQNKYNDNETKETYRTSTGHKIALPIYWRNKIYNEKEREILWLKKLDKKERWVCGERIDISKTEEEYYKQLKWYREKNKQLGYGDNKKNWSREIYEKERRAILIKYRIQKATPSAGS